jgi:hypothetical protein
MSDSTAYGDSDTAPSDWRKELREAVAAHASEAERAEQFEAAQLAAQDKRSQRARKVLQEVIGAACEEVATELRASGTTEVEIHHRDATPTLAAEMSFKLASTGTYRIVIGMDVSPTGDAVLIEAFPEEGPEICSTELASGWPALTLDEVAAGIVDAYKAILDDDFTRVTGLTPQ